MLRHRERMRENETALPPLEGKRSAAAPPDPEVVDRPSRRRFTSAYKMRIIGEADRCTEPGEVGRLLAVHGAPAAVITYNPYSYNAAVGSRARDRLGVPWFCIVADGIGPGSRAYAAAADRADGRVFLPWSGYQACQVEPNLHLDGGVGTFRGHAASVPTREPRVVLYAGRMTRSNGVELLADAFGDLSQRDVELWFCGKGRNARVEAAARRDARVKVLGAVTESRLTELSRTAYVFVNPRLSDVPGNAMLFPSKLLRYLAYGKPVVSTWTEGLAPEYRSILRIPSDETPAGLAASIDDVLGWDAERVEELRLRIGRFIDGRLWSVQAKRLVGWMEEHSP